MPIKQRTIDFVQDTRLLVARAREFERRGAAAEALVAYDMAASLITGLPPGAFHADLLRWKGALLLDLGDTSRADCLLRRSLDVAHYVLYAEGVAQAQSALAAVHLRRGDEATARQLYGDASLNAAAGSDQRLYAVIEQRLGGIAQLQGDLEGARIRYHMSLRALRATGDDEGVSWALLGIAQVHMESGRIAEAAQAFDQAEELASARSDRLSEARVALGRALLHLAKGELDDAELQHSRAASITDVRYERPLRAEMLLVGARLQRARGALDEAVCTLEQAAGVAARSEDVLARSRILEELGDVHAERGEHDRAHELREAALTGFTRLGASHRVEALRQRMSARVGADYDSRSSY
jgi:tetratricopeptide (TPR) repeat protein